MNIRQWIRSSDPAIAGTIIGLLAIPATALFVCGLYLLAGLMVPRHDSSREFVGWHCPKGTVIVDQQDPDHPFACVAGVSAVAEWKAVHK